LNVAFVQFQTLTKVYKTITLCWEGSHERDLATRALLGFGVWIGAGGDFGVSDLKRLKHH
jgi:hypothetical protein